MGSKLAINLCRLSHVNCDTGTGALPVPQIQLWMGELFRGNTLAFSENQLFGRIS